jgi:DNA primase
VSFDVSRVDVEEMMTSLGMRNIRTGGGELCMSCPFPGHSYGDASPSFNMNLESTAFFCLGCKVKGNAITFLAMYEGCSPMLAIRWLRARYGDVLDPSISVKARLLRMVEAKERPRADALEVLPELMVTSSSGLKFIDWEAVAHELHGGVVPGALAYPFTRRLHHETLDRFDWMYDTRWDRPCFGIRDENGRMVGLKARTWQDDVPGPKYLAVGDTARSNGARGFMPYKTTHVLFDLCNARWSSSVVLMEGELNVQMVHQLSGGRIPCVGLPGSMLSERQAILLRRYFDEVVLWFDDDDAGNTGSDDAAEMLRRFMRVKVVGPHEGDAMDMQLPAIENLIEGARPYGRISLTR